MPTIYWTGDSTVAANHINTYPQTGIGQVLFLYLREDVTVCNHAVNGRSTKSFLDEGRLNPVIDSISPGDFLFIQFGHNDSKPDAERRTEPYGTYQENLSVFINRAQHKGAFPVLITPLERRRFSGTAIEPTHLDYPDAMIQLANRLDIPYIDLTSSSRELMNSEGDEATVKWFMCREGTGDNTHLCYEGAVIFAGLIAEGLYRLGGIYRDLLIDSYTEATTTDIIKKIQKL